MFDGTSPDGDLTNRLARAGRSALRTVVETADQHGWPTVPTDSRALARAVIGVRADQCRCMRAVSALPAGIHTAASAARTTAIAVITIEPRA